MTGLDVQATPQKYVPTIDTRTDDTPPDNALRDKRPTPHLYASDTYIITLVIVIQRNAMERNATPEYFPSSSSHPPAVYYTEAVNYTNVKIIPYPYPSIDRITMYHYHYHPRFSSSFPVIPFIVIQSFISRFPPTSSPSFPFLCLYLIRISALASTF